ncbi:flagellar basal body-associated FliL family protein [Alicyclobacillus shizuokensis]|uniref:flagellar basal body-associated FliL family protein n=1 Tax=Alicyclobacillus shizuokensis TaxID=392014 RepID=UPI0009F941C8|nr:flagellar basal body-associated FliL family protein [Alicyclobacillus shizuokensis]MCL6625938.1 flagellar basal body-associated FliL family protein [Alicyclobacillus shizuokensis]
MLLVMSAAIAAIAVCLAVAVGWYKYWRPTATAKPDNKTLSPAQQHALLVQLPQTTTNLKGDGLVQFTIALLPQDDTTKQELSDMKPALLDLLNATMRRFTAAQLATDTGVNQLKQTVLDRVNQLLPDGRVEKVLILNLVTQ